MNINTKEIKKGIITINSVEVKKGTSARELEKELGFFLKNKSTYNEYIIPFDFIEDGLSVSIHVGLDNDDNINMLKLKLNDFDTKDEALNALRKWLHTRNIMSTPSESNVSRFYKTDFGTLIVAVKSSPNNMSPYFVSMELKDTLYNKFSNVKLDNEYVSVLDLSEHKYKIQKIDGYNDEISSCLNWLGDSPVSLGDDSDNYSDGDRLEVLRFLLSRTVGDDTFEVGVIEFMYLSVLDIHLEPDFFFKLDALTESLGVIGYIIEETGCSISDKTKISPYILSFEDINKAAPNSKELENLLTDKTLSNKLFGSILNLVSDYVNIPVESLTLVDVSRNINSSFDHHVQCEEIYLNYIRF